MRNALPASKIVSVLTRLLIILLASRSQYLRTSPFQEPLPVIRLALFGRLSKETLPTRPELRITGRISERITPMVSKSPLVIPYRLAQALENRGTGKEILKESLKETLILTRPGPRRF